MLISACLCDRVNSLFPRALARLPAMKNKVEPAQTITPLQNAPVTLTTQLSLSLFFTHSHTQLHNTQTKAKLRGLGVLAPISPVLSCSESYVKPNRTLMQATGVELARLEDESSDLGRLLFCERGNGSQKAVAYPDPAWKSRLPRESSGAQTDMVPGVRVSGA